MIAQQQLTALTAGNGLIAVDEHSCASCMIHDVTITGLSLTVLDGAEVPATFVLFSGSQARVCTVLRRSEEEIEACFADLASVASAGSEPVRTQRPATGFGRRRFARDRALRHAA